MPINAVQSISVQSAAGEFPNDKQNDRPRFVTTREKRLASPFPPSAA